MAYMSYCRFEGTHHELRACLNEVQDHIDCEAEFSVSDGEIAQFKEMVEYFHEFLVDAGILEMGTRIQQDRLEEVCEQMRHGGGSNGEY